MHQWFGDEGGPTRRPKDAVLIADRLARPVQRDTAGGEAADRDPEGEQET